MNEKNLINRPTIVIGLTILILIGMSYIPEGITILGIEIESFDILEDIKKDQNIESEEETDQDTVQSVPLEEVKIKSASILNTTQIFSSFAENELGKFMDNSTNPLSFANQPIEGNTDQMKHFFRALKDSRKKQIRIAHYGDSSLEGDLITSYLRNKFQQKYGGKGVGFLPITSEDVSFRETAKITFSDDWDAISISGGNPENISAGINGKTYINRSNSWVKYQTVPKFRTIRDFNIARIFYGNATSKSIILCSLNDRSEKEVMLKSQGLVNEAMIYEEHSKSLKINVPKEKSAHFYGISLEDSAGVYIDNFPLRGNSGVDLKMISRQMLSEFNSLLDYKLVILEFGLNILNGRNTNFIKYEEEMVNIIEELKNTFPETSFVLVSVRDKAIKRKNDFISDPSILKLVATQERIAIKSEIAFWNLFKAMGGENSMINWVNANPPLAYTDYTHFTSLGTKQEAELLFNTLEKTKDNLK